MSRITISNRGRERGFTLAGVLVLLTVMLIFIAYTVPRQWSMVMARERDREALFAMKQYARAILEYQARHGGLPTSLDQLKDARKPRFVRGPKAELVDPITGKVDWVLIPPQQPGQGGTAAPGLAISGNRQSDAAPQAPFGPLNPTSTTGTNKDATQKKAQGSADYVGPFVGVRPNKTGKSFLSVNGSDNYEDWSYTVQDLTAEMQGRAAALLQK